MEWPEYKGGGVLTLHIHAIIIMIIATPYTPYHTISCTRTLLPIIISFHSIIRTRVRHKEASYEVEWEGEESLLPLVESKFKSIENVIAACTVKKGVLGRMFKYNTPGA